MKKTMWSISLIVSFLAIINSLKAQPNTPYSNTDIMKSSRIRIEMLFPGGKSKALILSFDDGQIADRRLVKLMNEYRLKGTFHLNSAKLGTSGYLKKEEVMALYKGHEVSAHTANHPNLTTLSKIDMIYEIVEDRRELERLSGNTVRGMSYPFGNYNDFVIETIQGLGIEYARTVNDTYKFGIPDDFLKWDPTVHQFGKAYFTPNDPEKDKQELSGFYKLVSDFLKSDNPALFYVWGHSWENDGAGDRWNEMEKFFRLVSNNPEICCITQIELVDYINAFKNLKFSVEKNLITNLGSLDVFLKMNGKVYKIAAGTTLVVPE